MAAVRKKKTAKAPARGAAAGRIVSPPSLAASPLPLSPAVRAGGLVFVSGTPPRDKDGRIAAGNFPEQMHQVMANIKEILAAAGTSFDKVVKTTVILARMSDFRVMNEIYRGYFKPGNFPARTTIEAPLPSPDFLLEIECVAEL